MFSRVKGMYPIISTFLVALFLMLQLSACSPNRTEVSGWWYNQRWESTQANL